jgi:hypothetical protein
MTALSVPARWLIALVSPFALFLLSHSFVTQFYVAVTLGVNIGLLLRRGDFCFSYTQLAIGVAGLIVLSYLPRAVQMCIGSIPFPMLLLQQFLFGFYIAYGAERLARGRGA